MSNTITIINCGSSKVPLIEKCLEQNQISFETVKLDDVNHAFSSKGLIISGAPILLTEVDHQKYLEKAKLLFHSSIPVLGICFGHQLMGIFHGAKITRCVEDRDWQSIRLHSPFELLPNARHSIKQFEDHCEAISLPPHFNAIGSSTTCAVEIMKHELKPWYGVQFHPESSGESGWELISNFVQLCQRA